MDFIGRIKGAVLKMKILSPGDKVIIGVSGGPDSVALLSALCGLQHELGLRLCVAHFNHALRRGARTDQKFVQRLARENNLPFYTEQWKKPGREQKGSLEERARLGRMDFFVRLAKKVKADAIALGHTQDDLAETVLMRILRGSGLAGMRAILPQRKISNIPFMRPLLGIKKKEILKYLKRNKIAFRIDPTNRHTKFFRNKIRLELLPILEKRYNKNIREVLCNTAETSSVDYDYLHHDAQRIFNKLAKCSRGGRGVQFSLTSFKRQPPALRRMLLRLGVEHIKGDSKGLTLSHVQEMEDLALYRPCGTVVHLTGSLCARKDSKNLVLAC